MKKRMTKDLKQKFFYLILGGANRFDFERIHNFDPKKLDNWLDRAFRLFDKRIRNELNQSDEIKDKADKWDKYLHEIDYQVIKDDSLLKTAF